MDNPKDLLELIDLIVKILSGIVKLIQSIWNKK